MSFASDFASCLSPLPVPADALDDIVELGHFLERLHTAWEAGGGDVELLLVGLAVASPAGAAVIKEIGEDAAVAAGATVAAYFAQCVACAARVGGSAIWNYITASNDSFVKDALKVAANDAGIAPSDAVA